MIRKANPFDYSSPVSNPANFAGRDEELHLVKDEIHRLTSADKVSPLVALIGERRVGKTSILFRVQESCADLKLLNCKVTLSEPVAADPWEFWIEMFRTVLGQLVHYGVREKTTNTGFTTRNPDSTPDSAYLPSLALFQLYGHRPSNGDTSSPSNLILALDFQKLVECAIANGFTGVALLLDEAHVLAGRKVVTQSLRNVIQETGNCTVVFAGEPSLGRMFSDPAEPLFAQARVIEIQNFLTDFDVAACALLPLNEQERSLMSPMTIDHIKRLSRGKPNQIRMICNSIYQRYQKGLQSDLNITIQVIEDVLDRVAALYTEYDLKRQVDTIRNLPSVDLETLYNMTRYPNWTIQDIADLDESFRGESKSSLAGKRRLKMYEEFWQKFVSIGLLKNEPGRCVLNGDEFLHLYLRFWYEVRKYGQLPKQLILGRAPLTPFGEKAEKLVRSFVWELKRSPDIQINSFSGREEEVGNFIATIGKRFQILHNLVNQGKKPSTREEAKLAFECFHTCELVAKPGPYHLVCIVVRSLENPKDQMRIELYFNTMHPSVLAPLIALSRIRQQAEAAKVLIEDFGDFKVTLPTLEGLFTALGAPGIEEMLKTSNMVARWHFASIQHLLKERRTEGSNGASASKNKKDFEEDIKTWISLYEKEDAKGADDVLTGKISEETQSSKLAKLYNDRGYIRFGINMEDSRRDLERALNLHYYNLPLTLMNLSVIMLELEDWTAAISQIEKGLLLSLNTEDIEASYLRLRLLPGQLQATKKEIWEQHPANVIEAGYINLAYAVFKIQGYKAALEIIDEGLSLLPSSMRLKHAKARIWLAANRADFARPIYEFLFTSASSDERLKMEVRRFLAGSPRQRKKG
jgi:hypothetical protein